MGFKETFLGTPEPVKEKQLKEIERLSKVLAEVSGQAEVAELKEEISTLKIEKSKKEEEAERRERELQHKIGLERKRQEVEAEQAKKEAILQVREENLDKDREAFTKEMDFRTERFTEEVSYLKDNMQEMLKGVMKAQPKEKIIRKIEEKSSE